MCSAKPTTLSESNAILTGTFWGGSIKTSSVAHLEENLDALQWGLIPYWAKDPKMAYKTINARVETVDTAPSYRQAFKKRRCLIPVDGFYEWKKVVGGTPSSRLEAEVNALWLGSQRSLWQGPGSRLAVNVTAPHHPRARSEHRDLKAAAAEGTGWQGHFAPPVATSRRKLCTMNSMSSSSLISLKLLSTVT